ncbi:flagella biosynthesis regulatory protein FliZ [Escherichia coli]|nr:flagella biosynthesis regulatory protein FliZ [Escherichia coli]
MNSLYTAEGVMDKHSLWQRYVPLVRHEALRLQVRLPASVELDDLLQAGGIGLLNAVERYDALQGTAFTTYAVQRIRGAMLDELRSRDWVPRSVRRNAREVAQAIGQLEQELGRNATETEVAERLGIDIADYRQMLLDTNNSQLFSYDEWREEHGDSIELVTDDHQRENPLQQLLDSNLRQRVMEAIETLPEREKLVLTLYYQEELNLKEIGAVLEVGESRVSQLHSQTHCAHCRKLLDRITLVRDGKIVNKIEISRLDTLLDENGWQVEQQSWAALCRFCGDLHCKTQSDFFDIIGFKQFLFEQTEMSPGTVREYVVRLRRLGNHLHEQNISLDQLQDGFLDEILAPWLPTTSTNNYRIALRKYQHYQRQTCTGLVQKSSSLPASDIY